jgi:hypothetical protein
LGQLSAIEAGYLGQVVNRLLTCGGLAIRLAIRLLDLAGNAAMQAGWLPHRAGGLTPEPFTQNT